MKKSIFSVVVLATALFSFSSCNCAPKADLNNEADSLAYSYGVATTRGLKAYLAQMEVDSANTDAFLKGFMSATKDLSDKEKAEIVGMMIGRQVTDQMIPHFEEMVKEDDAEATLNREAYIAGFVDGFNEDSVVFTMDEAIAFSEEVKARRDEAKFADWKAENEKFLVENATKEGVVVLESGLQYEILKAGNGAKPVATDRVKVHYHGTAIDGTVFDSSVDRGEPAVFGVTQVIKGWVEALQLMPVGSKWRLYIPQELAYGVANMGTIKPYSTLIFDVELISIEK